MDTENMCLSRTRHNFVSILAVNIVFFWFPAEEEMFMRKCRREEAKCGRKNKQELFFSFLETEFAALFKLN